MLILDKILKPDLILPRITQIDINKLFEWNIKGIIIDVDNTILSRYSKEIDKDISIWINHAKKYFKIIILSNNSRRRILRAAKPLEIPYLPWTLKPLSIYYHIALMKINLFPNEVCAIGDQIFTDILGGKLFHLKTIYINPINPNEDSSWTKFVRIFERKLIKKWTKKIPIV
jgi:uncharacterized protein